MNKTININLAGIFFHIDEDAYAKLQHYLEAIRRSLTNTTGKEEIIHDIEARIAELFSEKIKAERQVVGSKEVDEIIAIMGQPEDYRLDQDPYEDEQYDLRPRGKKLYRDPDNKYLSGVSSGLGHSLGISPSWVRLLWVLLTFLSGGGFALIYLALWIFVPEAKTAADKLAMQGEPVTISNIERKIREGFDGVSGKVKDIDYEKYGYRVKAGASSAASAAGKGASYVLELFAKFFGIILLLFAGSTLIALFIGLFTVGTFGIIEAPWTEVLEMEGPGTGSIWIISILSFLAIGIPFFFLFILGLKILMKKVRAVGRTAKYILLALWIISVLGLIFFGIKQATETALDGEITITETLPVTSGDTLYLAMKGNPQFNSSPFRSSHYEIAYNENNEKVLWSQDIDLVVRPTPDSLARLEITKFAQGKALEEARNRALDINYSTSFSDNELILGGQLWTDPKNKYREQEVRVTLYLPEGVVLYAAENTSSFHEYSDYYDDILESGREEHYLIITQDGIECPDCPLEEEDP